MGANLSTFPDISVSERFVPGPEGAPEVPVLVYLPIAAQAPLSALLWIHGGGSVMGEASQDDLAVSQIVSAVGCVAVSVDYRLAPETPHPGQIEDGYAALRWLSTHAGELGVDPARIAIGGASAGGGLSAGLALLTRDRGEMPHLFLEEDLEYARRLMLAGVPTELHVYPGAFHGFNMVAGANVSQSALRDQLDALRRAFSRS